jgi:hypothetical protein
MFNQDAFSNGQVDSKLWLCRELERLEWTSELTHIYGGWYGVLGFLLLSREKFQVNRIESFDQDPACEPIADMINNNWVIKEWQFKAHTADCNYPLPGNPDLIINTSTEHFEQMAWFDMIEPGTHVVLQGNNLVHDDHFGNAEDLTDFENKYKLTQVMYRGTMDFVYPDWKFTRYMLIGIK